MAIQPNSQIVASGAVPPAGTGYDPNYSAAVVRFNSDGTLDTSFGAAGYAVRLFRSPSIATRLGRYPVGRRHRLHWDGNVFRAAIRRGGAVFVQWDLEHELRQSRRTDAERRVGGRFIRYSDGCGAAGSAGGQSGRIRQRVR